MPDCPNCQENVKEGWSHCPHCGANLKDNSYSSSDDPLDKLTKRVDKIDQYLTDEDEKRKKEGKNAPKDDSGGGPRKKRKTLFGD